MGNTTDVHFDLRVEKSEFIGRKLIKKKKKDFTDFETFKMCRKCDRLSGKRTLEAKYFTQNIGGVFKI